MRVGGKLNAARLWRLLNSNDAGDRRTAHLDVIKAFATDLEIAALVKRVLPRVIQNDDSQRKKALNDNEKQAGRSGNAQCDGPHRRR